MGVVTPDDKDARSAKAGPPAKKAGARSILGFDRSSLRSLITLGTIAVVLGFFVVGAVAYWRMAAAVGDLERDQYGRLATDIRARAERLVSRDRSRLKDAAFSDELYELIARGPAPPDSFIHPSFADWFPRLYGDQFVGVYDLDGRKLFAWSAGPAELESVAVSNPLLRILDNREPAAGLVRRGDDLYWVAGIPILPTNYADQTQPIRGYLVVAQTFKEPALTGLIADRPVRLSLHSMVPPKTPFRSVVATTAGGDSAVVRFALADVYAQQNTLAELVTSRGEFRAVERRFHWAALGFVLLLAVAGGLAWWLAQRWVVAPAARIAQSLQPVHLGQVPALIQAPVATTEWIAVSAAVNRLLANGRAAQDRFDRFVSADRDGLWEQDLTSGEWTFGSRFREMLGYAEAELPGSLRGFEQLLHPDEREVVLQTLQASSGSGRPIDLEVRLRRKTGEYGVYRLQATVQLDHTGAPARFTGRLVDQTSEREHLAAIDAARAATEEARRAEGRLIITLGRELESTRPERGAEVVALGEALTGASTPADQPFDLHQMIQEVAAAAPVTVDVAIAPSVSARVSGDPDLTRRILVQMVRNAAAATRNGRITIKAERPARGAADSLRISVEDYGSVLTSRDRQRLLGRLTGGESPGDGPVGIGLPLVRELTRVLGGSAGADFPDAGGARVWVELRLPGIKEEYAATAGPELGAQVPSFWSAPASESTFEAPAPSAAEPSPPTRAERVSNERFELVADETVVIDLDGPEPVKRSASSAPAPAAPAAPAADPAVLTQLQSGGQAGTLAGQMVKIFLKDASIRLNDLAGAVSAGEATAAAGIALSLKGMARLIGANVLAERCQALEDAAGGPGFDQAARLIEPVKEELGRVRPLLERFVGSSAPAEQRPPIDAATLEQIRSSLTADNLGLGTQLVSLFLAEAPPKLDALERAAQGGDPLALRSAADDLKGMCELVGAGPMSEGCAALAGSPGAEAERLVRSLRAEYARVQPVLEELLGAGTGA